MENVYKAAFEAYRNNSFHPEKRAQSVVDETAMELQRIENAVNAKATSERHKAGAPDITKRLQDKYISLLLAWLNAKSRTASTMITGPANFPTARNEKRLNSTHKRCEELCDFSENLEKQAVKMLAALVPKPERVKKKREDAKERLAELQAKHEELLTANKKARAAGLPTPVPAWALANSRARLKDAQTLADRAESLGKMGDRDWNRAGLIVRRNTEMERVQLIFDEKPPPPVMALLKSRGFRWAPSVSAWQRQLTGNAWHAVDWLLQQEPMARYSKLESTGFHG